MSCSDTFLASITSNRLEDVREFLAEGADPDAGSGAPLKTAAGYGRTDILKLLIQAGADVDLKDEDGRTALTVAAGTSSTNRAQAMALLINCGADVDAKAKHGVTALMSAAYAGHLDAVVVLLENGADVNARNRLGGWTALTYASQQGHKRICDVLRAYGAKDFPAP